MNNIIFFHVATIGHYEQILDEMLKCICESGINNYIDKINICVVGKSSIDIKDKKINVCHLSHDLKKFEFPTLRAAQEYAIKNRNANILYVHTKGCSTGNNSCIDDWRQYMSYFLITKYQTCLEELKTHDACGVDYRLDPVPHFSGNFWWAKASYLANLPNIEELGKPNAPCTISVRHNAEFWIGMNNPKVKVLWDCGISQYSRHMHRYPKDKYA